MAPARRARTKAALAAKKARGERVGSVPFGYTLTEGGKLAPEPVEQVVAGKVRELRASGLSLRVARPREQDAAHFKPAGERIAGAGNSTMFKAPEDVHELVGEERG
jgi:hypothetical protein